MFIDVEKYVDFLIENKLTQAQFIMLYILYRKKYNALNKYKKAFPTEDATMIGKVFRQDLIDRGFIKLVGKDPKSLLVSDFRITEKFTEAYLKKAYCATDLMEYLAVQKKSTK